MNPMLYLWDGLRNLASSLGTPRDKSFHHEYIYTPLTQTQIESAFASDWLARKIITIKPKHMTREWRTWQGKTGQSEAIYDTEKKFFVRNRVRQALIWQRLYGGAAIYIGDGTPNPAEPLDIYNFPQGGLKTLFVFRWFEVTGDTMITDVNDPNYGKPEFYTITRQDSGTNLRIHRSRFVFFKGDERPSSLFNPDAEWGQSLYDTVLQAVINTNSAAQNAAALVNEAKIDVITVPNLAAQLGDPESTTKLTERFTLASQLKSTINTLLLGEGETFERKQISFAGLPEIIHTQFETVAGAIDVPMTVIIGQAPAGLNATGDSDIRNFYDSISSDQENELTEQIDPLDEVLCRHTLGDRPKELVYEWNPLWQMAQDQIATIGQTISTAVTNINNTGLFMPEELRPAVADLLISSNFLPTLDQHLLKDTDPKLDEFFNPPPPEPIVDPNNPGNQDPNNPGNQDPNAKNNQQPPKLRVVGGDQQTELDL
jgi:phage-related protein (TIGR01555 family)